MDAGHRWYPSYADLHPEEPDDLKEERKRDSASAVLEVAAPTGWFSAEQLDLLTESTMRAIVRALAEYCLEARGRIWPAIPAALRRAWDEYLWYDETARRIDSAESQAVLS